jgi:TonB-dependent receptor
MALAHPILVLCLTGLLPKLCNGFQASTSAASRKQQTLTASRWKLLGSVLVYKNTTADMIDGGIAGTVDLVTRKPLDTDGFKLAGSAEMNWGDIAEESSPTVSFLGSNTWDTNNGRFGLQLGVAQSELNTRSYASQVTDPCYREASLDSGCIRVAPVFDFGVGGDLNFTPDNFPPAGSVIVPKGAGVRTTGYERDREAISLVGQWESNDGNLLVTAEYLRAEANLFVDEHAMLALVNDDNLFPTPAAGTNWNIGNNGSFQSGVLSQVAWRGEDNCAPGSIDTPANPGFTGDRPCLPQVGIPTENLRFQRQDDSVTEDLSLALSWSPRENLKLNFEAQHLEAERSEDGIIGAMQTYSDIFLDMTGETPNVQFRAPLTTDGSSDPNYFTNLDRTSHWFLLDSQIENEAEMSTLRADLEYHFSDEGFIRDMQFGARWSDRNRVTRDNRFGNWGNLSFPWAGVQDWAENWEVKQAPVFAGAVPGAANTYNPFADFQRGETPVPMPGGAALFFGGPDFLGEYFNGLTEQQAGLIHNDTFSREFGVAWGPVANRGGVIEGTPFLPGEISDVTEVTESAYARFDFAIDADIPISGNFGIRYVKTTIETGGELQFPSEPPDAALCSTPGPGGLPGFCSLSAAREAEFLAAYTGELIPDNADIEYTHWLPSLNIRFDVNDELVIRGAVSKGISRPDLASYSTGGVFFDNTNALRDAGTLETGPLFAVSTGNRLLVPVEAWNYDLSVEWYFDDVGSLTFSLFQKDLKNLISNGATLRDFTSDSGAAATVEVRGPANLEEASMKGFELAYQQSLDFLPEPFDGLGVQATYTYVDAGELSTQTNQVTRQPFAANLGLRGISEDTVNLVAFYETDVWSARLAYNWRSEFLITPRDDIFPYSPIVGESTGQLDGSVFYNFSNVWGIENMQLGLQVVNMLDEVTQTSQIIDFSGTRYPRSAFRNDRRYTLAARFQF